MLLRDGSTIQFPTSRLFCTSFPEQGIRREVYGRRGRPHENVKARLNTTPGLRGMSTSKIAQPVTAPRPHDDLTKSRITVQPGRYVKVPGKEKCATGVADFAGFASVANRLIFPGRR